MSDATTPSARWAADGQPDPHGDRYACERAALTLGNLTDDELANAVFLHGNEQPNMADMAAGKALAGIVYLTAAKDRIRWLSRALADAIAPQPAELAFDVEAMHTACVPGGSIVDPQVVADNVRAWAAERKPAELADASVIEHIAQQWDGCKYEAPGETLDIGDAIRRAGKRLSAELAEQQGDAPDPSVIVPTLRAMVRNYSEGHRWDHLDARMCAAAADRIESLEEALAARQPGTRVPIGRVFRSDGARCGIEWLADKVPTAGAMLYAATPAQGIDLGQLRKDIESLRVYSGGYYLRRDSVLALIDQHDAAPGVSRG